MNEKPTLLVVDDTPANLSLLREILKERYKVKIATSGIKALKVAAGTPAPNLILLDIMMPKMDGYETCEKIKKLPETKHIPVLLLTAKGRDIDRQRGLDSGADDYITKPFSPNKLIGRVQEILGIKS
jgi:putative two-component system response regulator